MVDITEEGQLDDWGWEPPVRLIAKGQVSDDQAGRRALAESVGHIRVRRLAGNDNVANRPGSVDHSFAVEDRAGYPVMLPHG